MDAARGAVLAAYLQLAELLLAGHRYPQAARAYAFLYGNAGLRDRATLLHHAYCLEHTGALDAAVARYREALAQEPDFLEAHIDLAGVLWRVSDFDGALAHARRAVELAPEHPHAVRILGTALLNLNRLEEAEVQLRRALQLLPGFALAELDLALVLLAAGRLKEAWPWYEQRWKETGQLQRPAFYDPAREWQGPQAQPLAGKRIAVYAEQGLGDALQFLRYVPLLQAQGATVFCIVPSELAALVEHSLPGVQCQGPQRQFEVDLHVALLSLPLHLGTDTLADIPATVPYLRAPEAAARHWRERLAPWGKKFKVGIAWSGYLHQINNRNRAMPLGLLRPLMELPGVQCFSLQKAAAGRFSDVTTHPDQLVDLTAGWNDFADSAAMLEGLDLVITVDTSIAHLAGALGRPVWVLLAPNADWRWLLAREDSHWYPSMRLFRRGFGEDRTAQVDRMVQALRSRLAQPVPCLRAMAPGDEEAVAALWRDAWAAANPQATAVQPLGHWLARVRAEFGAPCEPVVALLDGVVGAFMVIDRGRAWLEQLHTVPALQGRGLGRALLDEACRRMPAGWSLYVALANLRAQAFYERYGLARGNEVDTHPVTGRERVAYAWLPPA